MVLVVLREPVVQVDGLGQHLAQGEVHRDGVAIALGAVVVLELDLGRAGGGQHQH